MSLCGCVHKSTGAHRGQKRGLESLELVVVSCPMWLMGTELGPSAKAVYMRHHQAISPSLLGTFQND